MKFEHVGFNAEHWKGKTEAQFIAHESHHGLDEKQLKEAFALLNPKEKAKDVVIPDEKPDSK